MGNLSILGIFVGFLKNDSPSLDKSSKDLRYGSAKYSTSALSVEEVRSCVRLHRTRHNPNPSGGSGPVNSYCPRVEGNTVILL